MNEDLIGGNSRLRLLYLWRGIRRELYGEQRPCVGELISYLHDSIIGYVPSD